jgi:hypothetical protein
MMIMSNNTYSNKQSYGKDEIWSKLNLCETKTKTIKRRKIHIGLIVT